MLRRSFYQRPLLECARDLIGRELRWHGCTGLVVETEAYAEFGDEACHAFMRPAARAFITDRLPGTAYVYLNYGIHWMLNLLVKNGRENGLILIRAIEPRGGIPLMQARRGQTDLRRLCSGPGKLAQALAITRADHGLDLCVDEATCFAKGAPVAEPLADVRVGISRAIELPWRFLAPESPWPSVPFGKVPLPKNAAAKAIQPAVPSVTKRNQR